MPHTLIEARDDAVDCKPHANALPQERPFPLPRSASSLVTKDDGDATGVAAASATKLQQGNNAWKPADIFGQVMHSITAADVVCGRGRGDHEKWPGTVVYRKLVSQYREEYNTVTTGKARPKMIQQIIMEISVGKGRFVQKVAGNKNNTNTKKQTKGEKQEIKRESNRKCDGQLANSAQHGDGSCEQRDPATDQQEDTWIVLPYDKVRKKVSDDLRRAIRRERVKIYHQVVADEGSHPHNVMERIARRKEARVSMVGHSPAVSANEGADLPSIAEERQPKSTTTKTSSAQMAANQQLRAMANPLVWPNHVANNNTSLPLHHASSSHLSIGAALQQSSAWSASAIASMPLATSGVNLHTNRSSSNAQAPPSGLWDSLLCQANLMKSLQQQQHQQYLQAQLTQLVQPQRSTSNAHVRSIEQTQFASTSPMTLATPTKSTAGATLASAGMTNSRSQHEQSQSVATSEGRDTAQAYVRE